MTQGEVVGTMSLNALGPLDAYFFSSPEASQVSHASPIPKSVPSSPVRLRPLEREIPAEDRQPRMHVSNPAAEGLMIELSDGEPKLSLPTSSSNKNSLRAAYSARGACAIWELMNSCVDGHAEKACKPPAWFECLCRDLFFRTDGGKAIDASDAQGCLDAAARLADPAPLHSKQYAASQSAADGVDPFLWIDFDLLAHDAYLVAPFEFPHDTSDVLADDTSTRTKMCLGAPEKEYVCFAFGYKFPDRRQLPTSAGTEPLRLLIDPLNPTPTVFIQLSAEMPPAMWLPVKPTAAAVRRVIAEFASVATLHRDGHHELMQQRWYRAHRQLINQQMPSDDASVLRMMGSYARETGYGEVSIKEYPNSQEMFLGEYDEPEQIVERFDLNPFLFAIPLTRMYCDVHSPQYVPRIDGPGLATSLYRCVYSKALLLVQVHLSTEVKLPPQDPEAFQFLWRDSQALPKSRVPVFVKLIWPDNKRMSGGGRVVERFNSLFDTEFAHDIPVDACMAVFSAMAWAKRRDDLLGVVGMRRRLDMLEASLQQPDVPLLYPATRDIPNPQYTKQELVGMHIQYLAHLGDPDVKDRIVNMLATASAPVRMGCAKAALEIGDRTLFRQIVSTEPPGRMQDYMVRLVRKRKARDLKDAIPRLLDNQFEFAAPLWTARSGRLDPAAPEDRVKLASLK